MSDKDIRKEFQSKLNGLEAPLPPDGWERVERSLRKADIAKATLRRRWYVGSAAAVLILLVGSILFFQNPIDQSGVEVPETASVTLPADNAIPEPEIEMALESISNPITRKTESLHTPKGKISQKDINEESSVVHLSSPSQMLASWIEHEDLKGEDANKEIRTVTHPVFTASETEAEDREDVHLYEDEIITIGGNEEILLAEADVNEKEQRGILLAFNGKGGLTDYQQRVNMPVTLRSMQVTPDNKYLADADESLQIQTNEAANNVSEMEHDQPVSFGITVSKYLLDDLSIETGIVYSYLHSKTRNTNNNFKVKEEQKFHYLGIPLNVNYNLFSLKKLNVYASVGGMIEKDIYGEFRKLKEGQTVQSFNAASEVSEEKEVTKISQKNLQISVNAGVGISYPVYDRLRLYGKMGGAYYFDAKNQYKTIYSDRKIVMDLNVGLRYEF